MDPENVVRKIFELRLNDFCKNVEACQKNKYRSPIFNLLDVAMIFEFFNSIQDMTKGQIPIASKKAWSALVWDHAWKLEYANWHASNTILKENDLLCRMKGETRYLTWWTISDLDYRLVRMCEDMSKIICHASLLNPALANTGYIRCYISCLCDQHRIYPVFGYPCT